MSLYDTIFLITPSLGKLDFDETCSTVMRHRISGAIIAAKQRTI